MLDFDFIQLLIILGFVWMFRFSNISTKLSHCNISNWPMLSCSMFIDAYFKRKHPVLTFHPWSSLMTFKSEKPHREDYLPEMNDGDVWNTILLEVNVCRCCWTSRASGRAKVKTKHGCNASGVPSAGCINVDKIPCSWSLRYKGLNRNGIQCVRTSRQSQITWQVKILVQ